ncbi:hypothetical protein H8B15_03185 [Hymenobacter sp. BT507]|uniref:Uncharacterized protein n=1 Tax=Hymenobacter citatus TaxID=2763506 RepID=A0ABR7MGP1_9BACT|nr:hypothetical protein [Hymenobacter citatus]MBC6609910.1 hypothetical protein [Hymenobacter citatus]
MKHTYLLCALLAPLAATAQTGGVGIGTSAPDGSAVLELSAANKGLLVPRLDSAARVGIANPATGLLVFQTAPRLGFYYYGGAAGWLFLADKARGGDNLGSHTATRNLNLGAHQLVGNGGTAGLAVSSIGHVGIGTGGTAPRGPLDVASAGDTYLVRDPANSRLQSVYLPGHLYLAPYSSADPVAYVQARVPSPTPSTNLGLTLRTTHAGTLTDALTLNADGSARTAGPLSTQGSVTVPATSAFAYAAPKAYVLHLSRADFTAQSGGAARQDGVLRTFYLSSGEGVFEAPVHLPQGASITSYDVFLRDTNASSQLTVSLQAADFTASTQITLGALSSVDNANYQTINLPVRGVVDNTMYSYFLLVRFPTNSANLSVGSVRIHYTITQAE